MDDKENNKKVFSEHAGVEWAESVWQASWTYVRTIVDTVREPFLILDRDLRVIAANETFYQTFRVPLEDTENKLLYELGDGQWNIPDLQKLLEDILPKDTFFKGFQVSHDFPQIGRKVMLLNARRVYQNENNTKKDLEPIIFLAIEDVTELTLIAERLNKKTSEYEQKMVERAQELESRIAELTDLNKTVVGFSGTISELKSMIESLKKEIASLNKNKLTIKK
jgi:PAS domain-containing protein